VAGWPIGVIAIYNPQRTVWPEQQVNLLESLAAQASVSLEAAQLFEGIERERRRIETVLRTVPFGVAVADARYGDVRLNPAGAALLNLPADVNLASPDAAAAWQMYQGGRLVPPHEYPLARAAREGTETHAEEFELVRGGRRPISLLLYARPIRSASGEVLGAVAAFVDITTQKELQRELDVRRREAEEASVRKTRFLAAVSHDIRTPANAISLLAELIRRTAANPALVSEIPELARELQQSAAALVNLLSDVLDVARFDSGRIELQETEFPLGRLLADEVRGMQPLAREKNLILELEPPDESLWVRADRIKLARILGNLMGNAIKFTESGGVKVAASRGRDGSVHISVSDTGVGIAPEHLRHIFDEFFQLRNPERDRNKGTGLGLTICKRLVDAMEGRLEVQSTPGKGSVFTVTLPASAVVPQPVVN
jgi:signal transduction histidine kinase